MGLPLFLLIFNLTVRFFEIGRPHCEVLIMPSSLPGHRFAAIAAALVACGRAHPEGLPSQAVSFL